jgi:hypothetical protein
MVRICGYSRRTKITLNNTKQTSVICLDESERTTFTSDSATLSVVLLDCSISADHPNLQCMRRRSRRCPSDPVDGVEEMV